MLNRVDESIADFKLHHPSNDNKINPGHRFNQAVTISVSTQEEMQKQKLKVAIGESTQIPTRFGVV